MGITWRDLSIRMRAALARVDEGLTEAGARDAPAAAVAAALRALWPSSGLYACRLLGDNQGIAVLDEAGVSRPAWAAALVPHLDAVHWNGGATVASLPETASLPARTAVIQGIGYRGENLGAVAISLPEQDSSPERSAADEVLALWSQCLAPRLYVARLERRQRVLSDELEEQTRVADIGELAGPVAHESNNFLNVVLLQVALMELDVTEALRSQLQVIRRQGAEFKAQVQEFHARRHRLLPAPHALDLNRAIREALARLSPPLSGLTLDLATNLPPIHASSADVKRLLHFLFVSRVAGSGQGDLRLSTELAGKKVVLHLCAPSSRQSADTTQHVESLEWAACKGIVRRLEGKVIEDRSDQRLTIAVEFKTRPAPELALRLTCL